MLVRVSVGASFPASISNLTALSGDQVFNPMREGAITLQWTEPASGMGGIPAVSYNVRYRTFSNIEDDAAFSGSSVFSQGWTPSSAGNNRVEVITGLEPGATYYWAAKAVNSAAMQGAWSRAAASDGINDANFAMASDFAPPAPYSLGATAGTSQVSLAWSAPGAADLDYYRVYVDSTTPYDFSDAYSVVVDSVSTAYTHTGLTNGVTYYYRVTAVDKGAPSFVGTAYEGSASASVSAVPNAYLPLAPALAVDLEQQTTSQIRWVITDKDPAELGLYVASIAGAPIRLSPQLGPLTGTGGTAAYLETGLTPNTAYTRYGEAYNVSGSSFSAAVTKYTLANAPSASQGLLVTSVSVTLSWSANNNASTTLYQVEYAANDAFHNSLTFGIVGSSTEIRGLSPNTNYWVRVRAINGENVPTAFDVAVKIKTNRPPDKVAPKAPQGLWAEMLAGGSGRQVSIHWKPVTESVDGTPAEDLAGYRVRKSLSVSDAGGSDAFQSFSPSGVFAVESLSSQDDNVYYYRVCAYDESGNESQDSMVVEAKGDGSILNVIAVADDQSSRLVIPAEEARQKLVKENNGLDDDLIIEGLSVPTEEKGRVVRSLEFQAVYARSRQPVGGVVLTQGLGTVSLGYEVQNGSVVQGSSRLGRTSRRGQAAAPAAAPASGAPMAEAAKAQDQLSLFWHNGNEWVKVGGAVDPAAQTISLRTSRLGHYQIRQAIRVGGASITRVYPRIFTPNGDGWNDKVVFEIDNPALVPLSGEVFDASGAKVGDLVPGPSPDNSLLWDGLRGGQPVPAGVYVYQISVGGESANGTVVVAK